MFVSVQCSLTLTVRLSSSVPAILVLFLLGCFAVLTFVLGSISALWSGSVCAHPVYEGDKGW